MEISVFYCKCSIYWKSSHVGLLARSSDTYSNDDSGQFKLTKWIKKRKSSNHFTL